MRIFFLLILLLIALYFVYKIFFTNWIDLLLTKFNIKKSAEDIAREEKAVKNQKKTYSDELTSLEKLVQKQKKKL